jgi:1-deoxy-D-xylulose-5-phosphate reductoisomerase
MSDALEQTMQKVSFIQKPSLNDYFETDIEARNVALDIINKL